MKREERERKAKIERTAVDMASALEVELLPKMKGGSWDKVSYHDKRKIIDVIAERKARLFAQVDEMKEKQEEVEKNNWEEFWASKGVGRHLQ